MLEARSDQGLANESRFVPVIAAKQFLHSDDATKPAIDGSYDPAQPTSRVLTDLLVTVRIINR